MKRSSKVIETGGPTWAPFGGWSVLLEHSGGGIGLRSTVESEYAFAHRLDQLADAFAGVAGTSFARLPEESFHITLCDGVNAGMRKNLSADWSMLMDPTVAETVVGGEIDSLRHVARRPARWRPVGLEIRGHAVVVTAVTDTGLVDVRAQRLRLLERLGEVVGADVITPWRPHMTIGYLADDEGIDRLRAECSSVWESSSPQPGETPARLLTTCADIYEFSDMATFRKVS